MSDSKAADAGVQSVVQDESTHESRQPLTRKRLYVSDKTKSGCRVKVDRDVHNIRDQKLLRMRSTLGGLVMMQKTALQQSPRRCILPMHTPPNVGSRQKDRPLSSYLSGGSSARVPLLPHLLEPLPQLTGKEVFKSRHRGSMTERREGGGVLYHNMPRAFFPLAIGLGLRPKSPFVGVGGDIGKILDDSPNEQILPGAHDIAANDHEQGGIIIKNRAFDESLETTVSSFRIYSDESRQCYMGYNLSQCIVNLLGP